jgi:alanyl-tRNA synthetase
LGNHVWQAGAAKTEEKARIDITHYLPLTDAQTRAIEDEANRIITTDAKMHHGLVPKREAEDKYGFRLYQGGAIPGKEIRVVDIPGFDTEACGGTHLNHTGEVGRIMIMKSSKIQDGIVRIEYVAGKQAQRMLAERQARIDELAALLGVDAARIPAACELLFANWKKARKGGEQTPIAPNALPVYDGDVLAKASEVLSTQQQNLGATVKRFLADIEKAKQQS